ncbi:MAG: FAD-linked oxidase C-terminal domain-containing protein, partial [candidate division WOR-3 bacterium]
AKNLKQLYPEVLAEDIVVPLSRIPATIDFIAELERKFGVVIVPFGHIGDGNIHVDICRTENDRSSWCQKCKQAVDELIDFILKEGGQITAEHGIGSLKRRLLKKGLGEAEINLMKKIKKTLDPDGILNPGKILP